MTGGHGCGAAVDGSPRSVRGCATHGLGPAPWRSGQDFIPSELRRILATKKPGTRGHARCQATTSTLADIAPSDKSACRHAVYVAGAGAEATTSFARDRASGHR